MATTHETENAQTLPCVVDWSASPSLRECEVCHKDRPCYDLQGGHFICNYCYRKWVVGVTMERRDWEKATGKTWEEVVKPTK